MHRSKFIKELAEKTEGSGGETSRLIGEGSLSSEPFLKRVLSAQTAQSGR